jgi:hypothetical protein
MGTTIPPTENESDKASFGTGLGGDFEPLGKRIVIPKARDETPLKIKRQQTSKESDR